MSINPFRRGKHTRRTLRARAGTVALGGAALFALTTGSATASLSDSGNLNIQVTDTSQVLTRTTNDGAIVSYLGSSSPDNPIAGSSGTGVFVPFYRLAASPTEQGYNTDGTVQFDTKSGTWTHSMLVSQIPVVTVGGQNYFELYSDINENNSTPGIDLTDVQVYFTGNASLTGYPFPAAAATEQYAFHGDITMKDVNQGSGRADLRYLVPVNGITIPTGCDYGNAACSTYFVLYSKWGNSDAASPYATDGGFEEWKVRTYPHLTITNTPSASYTRTYHWGIDKSATPNPIDLFNGQSGPTTPGGTTQWTVGVTKTGYTDSAIDAKGTIVVANTSALNAVVNSVSDVFSADPSAVTVTCGSATFPVTLKPGAALTCTYDQALASATDQTNTASAVLANGTGGVITQYNDAEPVTFTQHAVNGSVDVTDTNGQSWTGLTDTTTETYPQNFSCAGASTDAGSHLNTATITQTGQQAQATVTVNCYGLTVTNTASAQPTIRYDWALGKTVDPGSGSDFFGGPGTHATWTVTGTPTAEAAKVTETGTITVTNPAPMIATGVVVNDTATGASGAVSLDCGTGTPGTSQTVNIPAATDSTHPGTVTCTYTVGLTDGTSSGTNSASASLAGVTYTPATNPTTVTFNPTTYTNTSLVVSDTRFPSFTLTVDNPTKTLPDTFSCGTTNTGSKTVTDIANTVTATGGLSSTAHYTLTCYPLAVANTVNTGYSRTHTWTITKTRVPNSGETAGALTLAAGEKYLANYQVVVGQTPHDGNYSVTGTVTVTNASPMIATGVTVADTVGGVAATVDCDPVTAGAQSTVTIPAATDATHPGSVTCSYSLSPSSKVTGSSTGTATLFTVVYSSTAKTLTWGSPSPDTDACVTVTDDSGTPAITTDDQTLGTHICAGTTFNYSTWIGPYPSCTTAKFTNTAALVTNDTGTTLTAPFTVTITVPCDTGCTLTQGYWKTHNASFHGGAPVDPTWQKIVPSAEQSSFYLSGTTYFGAMNVAPAGNPYWQLARQYIAAVLNGYNGASQSPVTATMADALNLFQTYTPAQVANGSKALKAEFTSDASALDNYNQGLSGVPHCSQDTTSAAG